MSYLSLLAAVTLIEVFAVSIVSKARGWPAYVDATRELAPAGPAGALAVGVVLAEIVVTGLIVVAPTAGLVLAAALLSGFTLALAAAVRRGSRTACRCFGASSRPVGPVHVVRNLVLVVLAVGGAAVGVPAPDVGAGAVVVFTATVLAVLLIAAEDVADLLLFGRN